MDIFERFRHCVSDRKTAAALDLLIAHFRDESKFAEQFEAMKLKIRFGLNLPLIPREGDCELDEPQQRVLEDRLLDACREVGSRLIQNGQLEEGWFYLQPVADRPFVRSVIENVPVNDDNVEWLINVALMQCAAPAFGYRLLIRRRGTCNAITTFDSLWEGLEKPIRRCLAEILVDHVYDELAASISRHVEEVEGPASELRSVSQLMCDRDWLFTEGGYHLDVTHLASIMRIGRIVGDPRSLRKLVEMAQYGQQLAGDFQFPGQPPFEETYKAYQLFFEALLGQRCDEAIDYFQRKSNAEIAAGENTLATETLVDLLYRLDRKNQALEIALERLADRTTSGVAPRIFEIASDHEALQRLVEFFHAKQDLLGFAVSVLQQEADERRPPQ
jgi:hypothetical protein